MAMPGLALDAFRAWTRIESQITGQGAPAVAHGKGRALVVAVARATATVALLVALPFLLLVRVSLFLYLHRHVPTWLALAAGAACTTLLVTAYAAWVWRRLTGRVRLRLVARRVALPLVLAYAGYALLFVSSANAKSERVRAYYTTLHPLLRLALSTLVLADRDIVITDLARRPADYRAMGLPVNDGSLHYVQQDGYAHAADLRTVGRGLVKNRLVQLYFWAMGFDTLRHTGTADHLHVELAVR
ncbi:MAG TPA: hypothetical protein VH158_00765 [Gemmatimonadales bacterium]|jgi:hypothetical protein|nr:hypothetical protein [Gemmatimonadales bacterium]